MSIATSIRNNSLTTVINNKVYTIASDHPNYSKVIEAIKQQNERLVVKLMDIGSSINQWSREGSVSVTNGEVLYAGKPMSGVIVNRILEFIRQDLPVRPMLRFIDKLMSNPSHRAVEELYSFLEHKNLPITETGNFLAYKGLRKDYFSITSGKLTLLKGRVDSDGRIYNGIGEEIECVRNEVDDNKENHCSKGIHAGSLEYATGFAQGKMVIVEINPADVVSIPSDCNCQKLRCCKYKVIGEYVSPLDSNFCPSDTYDRNQDEALPDNEYDEEDAEENYIDEDGTVYTKDTLSGRGVVPSDSMNDVEKGCNVEEFENGFAVGQEDAGLDYRDEYEKIRRKSKRNRTDYQRGYCAGWRKTSACGF